MLFCRYALAAFIVSSWSAVAAAAPTIDTAQRSGVAGFPIGIFGSQFGNTPGKVNILGAAAKITKWSDGVIEAVVPEVATGTGDLEIVSASGSAKSPFAVYAIDPSFLLKPTELENIAFGKKVVIDGTYSDYGRDGAIHAPDFMTNNDNGGAADLSPTISLAVDLGQAVSGRAWFAFHGSGSWYENQPENPKAYTVEASSDSTDGRNGRWVTLATITANDRTNRNHEVTMSGQHWVRWRITATEGGPAVRMREIRFFRPMVGRNGTGFDALGIYGDSNTANDFGPTGKSGVAGMLRALKGDGSQPITYIMGMSGQNASVLRNDATSSLRSLATALKMQPELRYIGIALGTNDSEYDSLATEYRENMNQGVQQILAAGKVPILARLVDTTSSGYGNPTSKKKLLGDIDDIAAHYRLIPGPDYYTVFRQNLAAYVSDGTHHTEEGGVVANRMWAETMIRSGIYSGPSLPGEPPPPVDAGALPPPVDPEPVVTPGAPDAPSSGGGGGTAVDAGSKPRASDGGRSTTTASDGATGRPTTVVDGGRSDAAGRGETSNGATAGGSLWSQGEGSEAVVSSTPAESSSNAGGCNYHGGPQLGGFFLGLFALLGGSARRWSTPAHKARG